MLGTTSRRVVVGSLAIIALALALAAVALLSRQGAVAPITIIAPTPLPGAAPASQVSSNPLLAKPATANTANVPAPTPSAVRVFVSGAVGSPGVYTMSQDDRVADAIAAAGGASAGADLSRLNLALRVRDESQYHVPLFGEPALVPTPTPIPPPTAPTQPADTSAPGGLIDLNLASPELLETLPGIGPVLAAAIVEYRTLNGPLLSIEEVVNVPRIGPATYENIRGLVTVSGPG